MSEDAQLLRQYVESRSEAAFGELVRRHIDLVFGTALRLAQGNRATAEDVAQAVFMDLARKAHRLPGSVVLSGWLYRHTTFTALKQLRTERRRITREQEAVTMHAINQSDADTEAARRALVPLLDEAMARLSDPDRDALVLRFFEGRDSQAVGQVLGISEAAAQKRVVRALEKLRRVFVRCGIKTTSSAVAATLAGLTITTAPTGLAGHITTLALAGAAVSGGALAALLMNLSKLKIAAGALALAGLSTVLVLQHQGTARLAVENAELRQVAAQLDDLKEENARLAKLPADAAELARLRQEQSELLRLRGEVARLRRQVLQASNTTAKASATPAAAQESTSPVVSYRTTLSAHIPPGQTLLAGGWKTTEGKRTLVFFTPKLVSGTPTDSLQQVQVQSVIIQVTEDVLAQLGWEQFKTDTSDSKQQGLLPEAQYRAAMEYLKQTPGAETISSPRVHTAHGVQASISVGSQQTINGEQVHLGPTIDLMPKVATDGSGIDLSIDARINQLREQGN